MVEKKVKGARIKNFLIIGLIVLIIALLYSGSIDDVTKSKFWTAVMIFIVVGGAMYIFFFRKKKIDVIAIARNLVDTEFSNFGRTLNISDVAIDTLDAETLAFGFESAGNLVSYKWDLVNARIAGRLFKKIDSVKDEANKREIMRNLAARKLQRQEIREMAAKQGLELDEEEYKNDQNQ
mgnify:CR=1 FL=1